jgi:glucosamine-6-phosphate deaminase
MMSTRAPSLPIRVTTAADAAREIAGEIVELLEARRRAGRTAVLGLPTGRTPLGVYDELVARRADLSSAVTFNLDEFLGLPPEHPRSFRRYMRERLFARLERPPRAAHVPASDLAPQHVEAHCREYERAIAEAGGVDLQLLGIGRNGHIGFNEPGAARESLTRRVDLAATTREDAAGEFGGLERVPREAITMGVATILGARRIRVLAFGEAKREIVQRLLEGPVGSTLPASFLRGHPDVRLYADAAALGELARASWR